MSICTSRMFIYLTNVYVILIINNAMLVDSQACPDGFFGPKCMYLCQCEYSLTCDNTGKCPNDGPCKLLQFGEGCQYRDWIPYKAHSSVPTYLKDNNDSTCNPTRNATSVKIRLTFPIPFSWLRIVVNDARYVLNLDITITDLPCTNMKKSRIGLKAVDIVCDVRYPMHYFEITGLIAPSICSVLVPIGRNVAIRETVEQSSTERNDINTYGPQNAVDYNVSTCSLTTNAQPEQYWRINFTYPVTINLLYVYTKNANAHRNPDLRFNLYGLKGEYISTINGVRYPIMSITTELIGVFRWIVIQEIPNTAFADHNISFCEVEIYGDYICPEGTFGTYCDLLCNCALSELCHFLTGKCFPKVPCPPGKFGFKCGSPCIGNCATCEDDGICTSCKDGYLNLTSYCRTVCPAGTYGHLCSLNCSKKCVNICNNVNGVCNCSSRYTGRLCNDCAPGYYDKPDCSKSCSTGCDNTCNTTNGYCTCKPLYTGQQCTGCVPGKFGQECLKNCSDGCANICHTKSGNCNCKPTYAGNQCTDCVLGRFGPKCTYYCSGGCGSQCHKKNGRCKCKKNFAGSTCRECAPGKFGKGCINNCSDGCADICFYKSGRCSCKLTYTGFQCTECEPEYYGPECNLKCSVGCLESCNRITGLCDCQDTFEGPACSDCKAGNYGPECNMTCSPGCNGICNKNDGQCSCKENYEGPLCAAAATESNSKAWLIIIPIIVLAGVLFVILGNMHNKSEVENVTK